MNPTKNKTRVLFVEEGSYTHKQALKQSGGWILADKSQVKASEEKKKDAKSVVDNTPAPTPELKEEEVKEEPPIGEGEANEAPTPEPKTEGKPKRGTKKQEGK